MPKETQGYIYQTNKGQYALAAHIKQDKKFDQMGKIHCQLFEDEMLTNPVLDEKGNPKEVLKDATLLAFIGFND